MQAVPTIDQTEIELAFLAARIIYILALRLNGVRSQRIGLLAVSKRREELPAARKREAAGFARPVGRTQIQPEQ